MSNDIYKKVFNKEIEWLNEEITILEGLINDNTTNNSELERFRENRISALNERSRLYMWFEEEDKYEKTIENYSGINEKEKKMTSLDNIIYTRKEIEEKGYFIENDIIERASVRILGHFGNIPSFLVYCSNCCIICNYNNTDNLGYLLPFLTEFFDKTNDDAFDFFENFNDIPCRLIFEDKYLTKCIGFGHFMKDKFVITEDLYKQIDKEMKKGEE